MFGSISYTNLILGMEILQNKIYEMGKYLFILILFQLITNEMKSEIADDILAAPVLEIIDNYIAGGYAKLDNGYEFDVIIIDFYQDDGGNCFLEIRSSPVYYICCLKTYCLRKDKLIAIYDWRSYCSTGLVKINKNLPCLSGYVSFEDTDDYLPEKNTSIKYRIFSPENIVRVE